MITMETIELLKGLKVEVKNFLLTNNKEPFKLVTVGGYEVLQEKLIKDLTEEEIKTVKLIGKGEMIDSKEELLPFIYVEDLTLDNDMMKLLIKFNSKLQLSKDEIKELDGYYTGFGARAELSDLAPTIKAKEELENKLVYIFEESPSTNSLSLSKQFNINNKNVVQTLSNIISSLPSLIKHVKLKIYSYKGNGNTIHSTYYEISEEIYFEFLNRMSTPKTVTMRLYRDKKKKEYFKGFINLRQRLYNNGLNTLEVDRVINTRLTQERKFKTITLQKSINNFLTHYNNSVTKDNNLSPFVLNRLLFNLINSYAGIDSISFSDNNRNTIKGNRTSILIDGENKLSIALNMSRHMLKDSGLKETLLTALRDSLYGSNDSLATIEKIVEMTLNNYKSTSLWNTVIKLTNNTFKG